MSATVRSGLLAGLLSGFIWMMIATAVDVGKSQVMIGGIAFLIGTGLVTAAIATMINRSRTKN